MKTKEQIASENIDRCNKGLDAFRNEHGEFIRTLFDNFMIEEVINMTFKYGFLEGLKAVRDMRNEIIKEDNI